MKKGDQYGRWGKYGVCLCGLKVGIGNFHSEIICPNCGTEGIRWFTKILRFVSTVRIFMPSTWWTGYWEERGVGIIERVGKR